MAGPFDSSAVAEINQDVSSSGGLVFFACALVGVTLKELILIEYDSDTTEQGTPNRIRLRVDVSGNPVVEIEPL